MSLDSDNTALYKRAVPPHETQVFFPKKSKFAVVIPVWNEGERLANQLQKMQACLDTCDIIISDKPSTDGSTDPGKLKSKNVRALIKLVNDGGLSSSLRCAFDYALKEGYEGVIMMDGNDKDDPAAISEFSTQLSKGLDFVQGSRYCPGGKAVNTPLSRHLLIKLIHAPLFSLICRQRYTDTTNGFRGYSSRFLNDEKVAVFRDDFIEYELPYYLSWAAPHRKFKITEIPVTRAYPESGPTPTKITLFRGNWKMLKPILYLLFRRY